jgi:non-specific serine/threonine protein kinase/serine/threonine-protein kinase
LKRELATAFEKLGSVQGDFLENNLGDAQGTLASYKKALEIRKQIDSASRNPNDRMALAIAYRLVAHQLWANGDARSARDQIHQAVAISQELYDAHPNDMQILYELGFDYETSGTIGYPGDPSARQKILDDYRRALVAAETLVKNNPNDIRNLYGYSVDLSEVGKWLEGSDAQQALIYYEKVLEIDRKLTQLSTDLRYQRSLAIDYGSVASVYDDFGDYPHALENNLKDLAIYQELVRKDPKNQLMRRGLAITYANTAASYAKTGRLDSALDYSKRALEIMQDFISAAPEKGYGSRIFATMLVYRGTILTQANRPEAAMAEIERGRSIYESLYKAGAGDQTNVAGADVKLAEAAARAGHEGAAAEYFQEALDIAEPLIAKNNLEAIYATADAHCGLGDLSAKRARQQGQSVEARRAHWMEAQSQYQQSLDAWNRLEHPNHSSPINGFQVGDPALVAKQLKVAEVALSARN